jgi:hypothetical protein
MSLGDEYGSLNLLGKFKIEYLRISKAIRHFVLPLAIYLYKKVGIKRKNFSKCRKVKKVIDPNFVMECKTLDEILVKFHICFPFSET